MPTYTYRCENCGHQFDKYQSFQDQPLKVCPKCRKHALHKVYQPAGVSFKGSGFYVTDKGGGKHASTKPAKAKPDKATENGASETKTEKKADATSKESTPAKPAKKED